MKILESSKTRLEIDGRLVDETFHDSNDAWEKAVNHLLRGKTKAIITETVTIEKSN